MAETVEEKDLWQELRKPFDPKAVGKLPKGGIQLDYVGHAAVTDRLNTIAGPDEWELVPMAFDERGIPVLDGDNLWCWLTILGARKMCVGDGRNHKERIGDALRNGAMRFGVALDLWSKDELESNIAHPENKNVKPGAGISQHPVEAARDIKADVTPLTREQIAELMQRAKTKGHTDKDEAIKFLNGVSTMFYGTDDFTKVTQDVYDRFKQDVIKDGWKKQ